MRCKNCGWPNKPNETTCVKCHTPLTADDDVNEFPGPCGGAGSSNLGKTVCEDEVFGSGRPQASDPMPEREEASRVCPKCGYPLRPGVEKCPNCKFQISGQARPAYKREEEVPPIGARRPTRMDAGPGGTPYRGTVNPYMMSMDTEPSFVLKPVRRVNERHEPEALEFEGREVSLNRANTEEGNPSITSREQAVVTHSDGHWYIEDRSGQRTTFVQAASRIELHDGDLILLGNRLFEFHK